ncbi:MAG TPA: hypothetical protein VMU94_16405 [Streptosporangiaceae bacterium]|nr:hypothetical protein [Streptosporangiaceae bacterium]
MIASLPRHTQFMEYWKALSPAKLPNGVEMAGQQKMSRLDDLRNGLKHHGSLPGKAAVDQACADVRDFFEASAIAVFGISFADIDMAEVIPQPEVRGKVKAATAAAAAGSLVDAMGELAEVFDTLTGEYAASYWTLWSNIRLSLPPPSPSCRLRQSERPVSRTWFRTSPVA